MLADLVECRDQERSLSAFVALGHELCGEDRYVTPSRPSEDGQIGAILIRRDHPLEAEGLHQPRAEGGPDGPDRFIGVARLAVGRQVVLESTVERFERPTDAFSSRVEGECEVMSPDELLADVLDLGLAQWVERSVHDVSATVEWRQVDGDRPGRDDGGYHTA